MMKILIISICSLLLTGCYLEADIIKECSPQKTTCTDTRDGEVFSYRLENVSNKARVTFNDQCFDVTDDTGKKRTMCASHQAFLKCHYEYAETKKGG